MREVKDKNDFLNKCQNMFDEYLNSLTDKLKRNKIVEGHMGDVDNKKEELNIKGVYIIFNENEKPIYVGDAITDNFTIYMRLKGHLYGNKSNGTVVNRLMDEAKQSRENKQARNEQKLYLKEKCIFIAIPWESLEYNLISEFINNGHKLLNIKGK